MFGRRGEIVWKKAGFFAGFGGGEGSRDYDAYLGYGLLLPFYLTKPIHTFGWGESGRTARAIPLRKDHRFALRVYLWSWLGVLCGATGVGFLLFCCSGYSAVLTAVCVVTFLGTSIGLVVLASRDPNARDRKIRLLLGRHEWGSSDPATWTGKLAKRAVEPKQAFGVKSFEKYAQECLSRKIYSKAMCAARLCVALEDEAAGERLTDEILKVDRVRDHLAIVENRPERRDEYFGDPVSLSKFITGDLESVVFEVNG
jgi:hypothetical protein